MEDGGFDAPAGDVAPGIGVKEAGPDFAVGDVDEDGDVGVGGCGGWVPGDGGGHLDFFLLFIAL